MNYLTTMILFACFSFFLSISTCAQSIPDIESFRDKAYKLAMQQDEKGIVQLQKKLDEISLVDLSPESQSNINVLKAFCGYQLIIINYGQIENSMNIFTVSKSCLEESLKLNPVNLEARALLALFTSASLPPGKAYEAVKETIHDMKSKSPESPFPDFMEGSAKMFTDEGGAEYFQQAISKFEKSKSKLDNDWWYWMAKAQLADIYLGFFKQKPHYREATEIINSIKSAHPDMGYLRIIEPAILDNTSLVLNQKPRVAWTELATDEQGDAADPVKVLHAPAGKYETFDAKGLSYYLDFSTGTVWFKFSFHEFQSENVGINVMIDNDGNSENGAAWFSNRDFKYDLLVTLWIRKEGERYIGINGISKTFDADRRRMAKNKQGAVKFFVDNKNKEVVLGISHSNLGSPQSMKVAGAVGSTLLWSDNIPNKGYAEIKP